MPQVLSSGTLTVMTFQVCVIGLEISNVSDQGSPPYTKRVPGIRARVSGKKLSPIQ